jgi:hypothetical protein
MAALAADRSITFESTFHVATKTAAASITIYKGALLVNVSTGGLVKPAVDETTSTFAGIALNGAAASTSVTYVTSGFAWIPCETNVDANSIGKALYANDDDTVTETATLGPVVGRCIDVVGSEALVWLGMGAATAAS